MGSCTPDKNGKLKTDKKRACRLLLFFYQCQSSLFLSTFLFFLSTFLFFLPVLVFHFLSTLDFLMFSTRLLFPFLSTFDFPLYYFNKCSHYLVYNFAFFIRCILPFFVSDHFFVNFRSVQILSRDKNHTGTVINFLCVCTSLLPVWILSSGQKHHR